MLYAVLYSEPHFQGQSAAISYTGPRTYGLRGLGLPKVSSLTVPKRREDGVLGVVTYGLYLWRQRPHHLLPVSKEVGESCLRCTDDVEDLDEWCSHAHFVTLYICSDRSPSMAHTSGGFAGPDLNIVDELPAAHA
ncbi:hypothetical protein C6N75_04620 [Streptomyces solincola]|uniref:Uncharacterized protein n=1 Tax=Streptomyces solincola TaxID=2100817 RepID=A0A2S9Q193_9ACTN|nr:hypothetical protein [Streptomyces solincola]PRH80377.1 hypothetical protein C6N75_04620 [Streptomyces solincola]